MLDTHPAPSPFAKCRTLLGVPMPWWTRRHDRRPMEALWSRMTYGLGGGTSWRRAAQLPLLLAAFVALIASPDAARAQGPSRVPTLPAPQRLILLNGNGTVGGEQVLQHDGKDTITVSYRYKDNGRGPEFTERIRLGSDSLPDAYDATGTSAFGNAIDDHYERRNGVARWKSASEQGESSVTGPALYLPLSGSFVLDTLAATALARAGANAALLMLPSGQLTHRQLDEMDLSTGGRTIRVRLMLQTGLSLLPQFLWITDDAQPRHFASIFPGWMTAIESGWESQAKTLMERQSKAEGQALAQMAGTLRRPLRGMTVIRNVRPFDSETATVGPPSDVYMLRDRITAIRPTGPAWGSPDNEIDGGGRIILPGLFDMHAHVDRWWSGGLNLANGVTTVRDMGNNNDSLQRMLDEVADGKLLMPDIVPCGFLEGDSPHASNLGFVIKTYAEARDAVDWYATRGYRQLKIYNSFPRDMVGPIVAYAHGRGMRVSGHVPVTMRAQEVVELGFDEVQHINQVALNFLVTADTDTRTLERFTLPAEKMATFDLDSAEVTQFIELLKRRGTVIDPTLAAFDFIQHRDGDVAEPLAAVEPHLPPLARRWVRSGDMKIPDDATAQRYRASYAKLVEFAGRLHRAGVPIVAGTDDWAGFTLHSELDLYVRAGLTPARALQIATRDAARHTGTDRDRGSIAVGKRADLVLVDGDPTRTIGDLRRVALVLTQGAVISPGEVFRSMGVEPFVAVEPSVRNSTGRTASVGLSPRDEPKGESPHSRPRPAHAH